MSKCNCKYCEWKDETEPAQEVGQKQLVCPTLYHKIPAQSQKWDGAGKLMYKDTPRFTERTWRPILGTTGRFLVQSSDNGGKTWITPAVDSHRFLRIMDLSDGRMITLDKTELVIY